jgi:hypothetical protein
MARGNFVENSMLSAPQFDPRYLQARPLTTYKLGHVQMDGSRPIRVGDSTVGWLWADGEGKFRAGPRVDGPRYEQAHDQGAAVMMYLDWRLP